MSGLPTRAHPRSRGENEALAASDATDKGSSPLTRGKLLDLGHVGHGRRLIPAHAGKTSSYKVPGFRAGAHPRSRGENDFLPFSARFLAGSSPLTRGKRGLEDRLVVDRGLIPAHAGKTVVRCFGDRHRGAHPRSRGENPLSSRSTRQNAGSSPLTRGKHCKPRRRLFISGLIPAHAGKTLTHTAGGGRGWAHPRSRGENRVDVAQLLADGGSSPLTRGKPLPARPGQPGVRLIPAHAGKTTGHCGRRGQRRAHPRSRGENARCLRSAGAVMGSSPLTRGKPRA